MTDGFERARQLIPGGVSSPARAFGAVGGDPVVADRGEGAYIVDTDGRRFIDYIQGFGSVILGHAHRRVTDAVTAAALRGGATGLASEAEVHLAASIVDRIDSVERVRFVTSGTEASMTAARIARAATKRDVIVKFEGCYHGHSDAFLAKAGSGVATFAVPMAAGVPAASVADTIVAPYNDVAVLTDLFTERGSEIAAVFVEPVAANMGVIPPEPQFLEHIVALAADAGAIAVFDEVVTGFRMGTHGAQRQIRADLTMFGKVIGGGLPIGAVGGRADLMDLLAPVGPVYQAGTYAAHPHALTAGAAVLEALTPDAYATLEASATKLFSGLAAVAKEAGAEVSIVRVNTFGCVFFRADPPIDFAGSDACDKQAFARFHRAMRERGVLIAPSPFEAWFPSLAHTDADIDRTIEAASEAFITAKEAE